MGADVGNITHPMGYSGSNLPKDKKNSKVKNVTIDGSGVANKIIFIDPSNKSKVLQDYVNDIQTIAKYCQGQKVYFACKAVNYRAVPQKWDGDRPLSVWVDWSSVNGIIYGKLNFDDPLGMKADEIGNNIKIILNQHNITQQNFIDLKAILDVSIPIYG